MKLSEIQRPDLAHLSCGICLEAFQDPPPPPWPAGFDEAAAQIEAAGAKGRQPDPELLNDWWELLAEREAQAAAYRLSSAAFEACAQHAEYHTLDEHLSHGHENRIPLVCERCGHEEESTSTGLAALRSHKCGGPVKRAYAASVTA